MRSVSLAPNHLGCLLDEALPDRRVVMFTRRRTILATTQPTDTRSGEGLWILAYE